MVDRDDGKCFVSVQNPSLCNHVQSSPGSTHLSDQKPQVERQKLCQNIESSTMRHRSGFQKMIAPSWPHGEADTKEVMVIMHGIEPKELQP